MNEHKQQTASIRYLHIAPRKVRLIANTLKGLSAQEAEAQLMLRPQRSSEPLLKLVRSAMASAFNNQKLPSNALVVYEIRVDQGPILKRSLPRAQGRATPLQKKMSHVTLILREASSIKKDRFVIAPPEKKKKAEVKPKKEGVRSKAQQEDDSAKSKGSETGFMKKVFTRKSV